MSDNTANKVLRAALIRYAVLIGVGVLYLFALARAGAGDPDAGSVSIFLRIFFVGEPSGLVGLLLFVLYAWWTLGQDRSDEPSPSASLPGNLSTNTVWFVSLGVAVAVALSARYLHDFSAFSMDEFGAVFQAQLFASGRVAATIPTDWRHHIEGITPVFVFSRPLDSAWVSSYLPGNAFLRTPFELLKIGWLQGVLLAAAGIVTIGSIAKKLWPGEFERQLVAVGALATSMQFLVVAGTPYAMTAHLVLNLMWLRAWISPGAVAFAAGPIGMLGIFLHQPIPHLLFAAPFLLRALMTRRWALLLWTCGTYAVAVLATAYWRSLVGFGGAGGGLLDALGMLNLMAIFVLVLHVLLLLTWQSPLVGLLLIVNLRQWRVLRDVERDLILGILGSLGLYLFFRLITQGHGWGWRYGHQVIGSVALLAGFAWPTVCAAIGRTQARRLALASVAITLLWQVPTRTILVRHFALPFAQANRALRNIDADIVIVPTDSVWYGRDLVRNDPDFSRPILVHRIYADDTARLQTPLPERMTVYRVTVTELEAFGLERLPALPTTPPKD